MSLKFLSGMFVVFVCSLSTISSSAFARDLLPSWNEGPAKKAIVEFVKKVTSAGELEFVKPSERIVVFDNDGTLWVEKPVYAVEIVPDDEVQHALEIDAA